MATTFGINGSTISPSPSEIRVTPPQHQLIEMADGTYTASKRTKGTQIMVTWGVQESYTAAMAAVRTALGTTAATTITFTDPSGTTTTNLPVVHKGLPEYTITNNQHYGRFSLTFFES
jgi:hypothetical protein